MKYKINDELVGTNGEIGVVTKLENDEYEIIWNNDGYISHIPVILVERYFRLNSENFEGK